MKSLFKTYEEYLSAVITMVKDYSKPSLQRIRMANNVCSSYMNDNEKMYRMNESLMLCFWDFEEAINMGFPQYLKQELRNAKEVVEYHKYNCDDKNNCIICEDRKRIKNVLVNNNERKESDLYPF
jgi:hypothetical protein